MKIPTFPGFHTIKMVDFPWRFVSLPEGNNPTCLPVIPKNVRIDLWTFIPLPEVQEDSHDLFAVQNTLKKQPGLELERLELDIFPKKHMFKKSQKSGSREKPHCWLKVSTVIVILPDLIHMIPSFRIPSPRRSLAKLTGPKH